MTPVMQAIADHDSCRMQGYVAMPPPAASGHMGGSGSFPAGFGPPPQAPPQPQGYGSGALEPQQHIGDLGLTQGKKDGQQLPASNGNDPFAGLGF